MAGFITINNQQISWSFIGKVRKALGGDMERTMDCFYKARNATPPNGVVKYIAAGFIAEKPEDRYSLLPSKDREERGMQPIRDWWYQLTKPKGGATSLRDIMREIARDGP